MSKSQGARARQPAWLAVSVGCPSGIGPEIAVRAATSRPDALLVGDLRVLQRAAQRVGVEPAALERIGADGAPREGRIAVYAGSHAMARLPRFGRPDAAAGEAQLAWIDEALSLVARGAARALVTGPVSKAAIATCGRRRAKRFRGHTEYLAEATHASEVVMAFDCDRFTISLATTHVPVARLARVLTREDVVQAGFWLVDHLRKLGRRLPRVVVCGLNPHAGENGLLGREEIDVIAPALVSLRKRLARARLSARIEGPVGAESALRLAHAGRYDGVVAMFHDQATIAAKLLAFGDAVNVTLGLGIVRTSVDHGTGYDLAGKGKADPSGLSAALGLADRLAASSSRRR